MDYNINVHRIVRQRKGDNQYIEKHSHDYFHYIYILNGEGSIIVDKKIYNVKKYDLVMVPPKIDHEIFGKNDLISMDIKFICHGQLEKMLKEFDYYINGVTYYEDKLIRTIFEEALNRQALFGDIINIKTLELIFIILRRKNLDNNLMEDKTQSFGLVKNSTRYNEIKPVLTYIDSNISKSIRVSELAALMGFSDAYFSIIFKEIVGCSPMKYINIRKCEKAKEMMFYTSKNITEISEELGFETVHYFSKVFKSLVGISPKNYQHKGETDVIINVDKNSIFKNSGDFEIPMKNINS